jgi:hypothetical protein
MRKNREKKKQENGEAEEREWRAGRGERIDKKEDRRG